VSAEPYLGLFISTHETDPTWELRTILRQVEVDGVRAGITYGASNNRSLQILLGDVARQDFRWSGTDLPTDGLPEVVNTWGLVHEQYPEWRALQAESPSPANSNVFFRADTAGDAANGIVVRATVGTPAVPAQNASPVVVQGYDTNDDYADALRIYPTVANAVGNGVVVRTLDARGGPSFLELDFGTGRLRFEKKTNGPAGDGSLLDFETNNATPGTINVAGGDIVVLLNVGTTYTTAQIKALIDGNTAASALISVRVVTAGSITTPAGSGLEITQGTFAGGYLGTVVATAARVRYQFFNTVNPEFDRFLDLEYISTGSAGNGFQVVFVDNVAGNSDATTVVYNSARMMTVTVGGQGGQTPDGLANQINAARHNGNQLIRASRTPNTTNTGFNSATRTFQAGTATLAGGQDAGSINGTVEWDSTNRVLTLYTDPTNNATATTFRDAIRASNYPSVNSDKADLVSAATGSYGLDSGDTYTFSGGVNPVARTNFFVSQNTVDTTVTVTITGLIATDTIADLKPLFAGTSVSMVNNAGVQDTALVHTSVGNPGNVLFRVTLAGGQDAIPKPDPRVGDRVVNGQFEIVVQYIGDNFENSERTRLSELRTAWEAYTSQIEFVATGAQTPRVNSIPTAFTGGVNYVPPDPIEIALDDDERFVEVAYAPVEDTLNDINQAFLSDTQNPSGVEATVIAGTVLAASPSEVPLTVPMVPGSTTGEIAEVETNLSL